MSEQNVNGKRLHGRELRRWRHDFCIAALMARIRERTGQAIYRGATTHPGLIRLEKAAGQRSALRPREVSSLWGDSSWGQVGFPSMKVGVKPKTTNLVGFEELHGVPDVNSTDWHTLSRYAKVVSVSQLHCSLESSGWGSDRPCSPNDVHAWSEAIWYSRPQPFRAAGCCIHAGSVMRR